MEGKVAIGVFFPAREMALAPLFAPFSGGWGQYRGEKKSKPRQTPPRPVLRGLRSKTGLGGDA
jgi:hypothetical protein